MAGLMFAERLARMGRRGDNHAGHLTEGELVVPKSLLSDKRLRKELGQAFRKAGLPMGRYLVGGADDSRNPRTGLREYWSGEGPGNDGSGGGDDGGGGGGGGDDGGGGQDGGYDDDGYDPTDPGDDVAVSDADIADAIGDINADPGGDQYSYTVDPFSADTGPSKTGEPGTGIMGTGKSTGSKLGDMVANFAIGSLTGIPGAGMVGKLGPAIESGLIALGDAFGGENVDHSFPDDPGDIGPDGDAAARQRRRRIPVRAAAAGGAPPAAPTLGDTPEIGTPPPVAPVPDLAPVPAARRPAAPRLPATTGTAAERAEEARREMVRTAYAARNSRRTDRTGGLGGGGALGGGRVRRPGLSGY